MFVNFIKATVLYSGSFEEESADVEALAWTDVALAIVTV